MAFKINGFGVTHEEPSDVTLPVNSKTIPRKCLVQVFFPHCNQTITYFNDQFDLKTGDIVFVEGKMESERGIVRSIQKNFKIKLSDYKRVISVADTNVSGKLCITDSHILSFNLCTLPFTQVRGWVLPPQKEEDPFEIGYDDTSFFLDKLTDMNVSPTIFERGKDYFIENRVTYIGITAGHGNAIVEGAHAYELEFDYSEGEIKHLTCTCPCGYTCKHEVAAMLQLRELLEDIEEHYIEDYKRSNHFSAVAKGAFFSMVLNHKQYGNITL